MLNFLIIIFLATEVASSPTNTSDFKDRRIIGGQEVNIKDRPFQAGLLYIKNGVFTQICGAVVIHVLYALTAAHCIELPEEHWHYAVHVGSTHRDKGGVTTAAWWIEIHPNYNPRTHQNDVALIHGHMYDSGRLNVGCIPLADSYFIIPDYAQAVVSGWGRTIPGVPSSAPQNLRQVTVNIIPNNKCRSPKRIFYNMICAWALGKDSCQGDSGGPLTYNGKLIGIVSFGAECASPIYPGVYTRVSAIRGFVAEYQMLCCSVSESKMNRRADYKVAAQDDVELEPLGVKDTPEHKPNGNSKFVLVSFVCLYAVANNTRWLSVQ
ncbi:hypodermin-A-like [Culicoides brevitarsis]|uniref:hypodermin-A-like n=1 Tax=Culicoides brevitarsis TaxID=469753 RepID=UPI00307C2B83